MAIQHNALTGADLHEPRGIASASSGSVYVANGAGSGSWQKVDHPVSMGKLVTGSSSERVYLPFPISGRLKYFSATPAVPVDDFYPGSFDPMNPGSITIQLRSGADALLGTLVLLKTEIDRGGVKSIPLNVAVAANSSIYAVITGSLSPEAGAYCYLTVGVEA